MITSFSTVSWPAATRLSGLDASREGPNAVAALVPALGPTVGVLALAYSSGGSTLKAVAASGITIAGLTSRKASKLVVRLPRQSGCGCSHWHRLPADVVQAAAMKVVGSGNEPEVLGRDARDSKVDGRNLVASLTKLACQCAIDGSYPLLLV